MSQEPVTYFGIDLGTTYSVVSYVDQSGHPTVVRNVITNSETTPSAVYFENAGNVVVGASAKNVSRLYPDRVVQRVKRRMGREAHWEFDGNTYTPESISALILKQLAEDAAEATGHEVRQVVITVPAYFGMLERDATRNAGRIAGLDVIGIVPEPVAAALQYEMRDSAAGAERIVLVYDLGGGTFDTTVIRITPGAIDVLCTDGEQELGGVDWDNRLIKYLVDEFVSQAEPAQDPYSDEEFMQSVASSAEELKHQLSQVESRKVPLRFAGAAAMIEVTRTTFEQITRDLLDTTLVVTDRVLAKLADKLGAADPAGRIDDVLLVGGSTKMPAVKGRLTEKYGWKPRLHDPDLAVAKGAARFALSRALWDWKDAESAAPTPQEQEFRVQELALRTGVDPDELAELASKRITTVLPKAFGVRLVDTDLPNWEADPMAASYVEHLVHADDSLPSDLKVLHAGTVVPNQTDIEIAVYEQAGATESRDLAANKAVDQGKGVISGLPPLPVGSPINITLRVDDEGLLTVRAVEPGTGKELTIEVRVSMLTEAEVVEAQQMVSAIAVRA
ncbi:Hsp70 family protein [Plantactinospora soyae]|uniref:Molecular chaperone DnaK (HSP70) n=1 Tax=Plantactinospora soyae TaxID=1544732 RepID=A0A927MIR7_9ACTN|nr:Hsp70 family protein [Plantactinospora soyae]MBE1491920.1 molecular chaperone DnaK (HSP70) [Plantactinospora soyae]